MSPSDATPAEADRPPREIHTITDLRQVKVLADPLRLKILEELSRQARTTKQVAKILGEKPTKLYHHVESLARVGLIALHRTRQNRGTLEKYYLAIARGFLTDAEIFCAGKSAGESAVETESWQAIAAALLESSAVELRGLARTGEPACRDSEHEHGPPVAPPARPGICAQLKLHAGDARVAEIQEKLESLLKEIQALDCDEHEGHVPYRMTLAFYPLDCSDPRGDRVDPVGGDGDDDDDPGPDR